jgi:type 2 lantibiotic biosynthesis protein LanM
MEFYYERVTRRAAVIDEVLSDIYEDLPGQKTDADLAARRLAAWCRSCAGGDWSLFARRLERDGLSIAQALARFATVRRNPTAHAPRWIDDARWIGDALQQPANAVALRASGSSSVALRASGSSSIARRAPVAFEHLLTPVIQHADALLFSGVEPQAAQTLTPEARDCLRRCLAGELSGLIAPAVYQRFTQARDSTADHLDYEQFVQHMRADGFRQMFDETPVLLRVMASLTRQWIETSTELITRLHSDMPSLRDFVGATGTCRVSSIEGELSDPHNFGRSVRIITFEGGERAVYKPKDLGVDAAWHVLVERLNRDGPVELRAARVLPRAGYGWAEFVEHSSCDDAADFRYFFRRAGGLLALLHCFVGVDMHQENVIASGPHPVPIDLEMILQPTDARFSSDAGGANAAANQMVIDSVMTVGLLPAYGRYSGSKIFATAGVTSNSAPRDELRWLDVNSDNMRPVKVPVATDVITNLPHVNGHSGRLGDHIDDFISGFGDYAEFLRRQQPEDLFRDFAGLPVRTVLRPTRYYYLLLQRLRNHGGMDDGIAWSAQADFGARLGDWDTDADPTWALQRTERTALVDLNVPYFTTLTDEPPVHAGSSGLQRAHARLHGLDEDEIAWQIDIIQQNVGSLRPSTAPRPLSPVAGMAVPPGHAFVDEADSVANTLRQCAIRRGASAAWVGLDWLGHSKVSQLVVLGPDLYNGTCGIALFLAAHAAVTKDTSSEELARAALVPVRDTLHGRSTARVARSLGLGGALGLGSIVYGLAVVSALTGDPDLLADAHTAAELITDELISADVQLDLLGGSAGAVLGLLRLHRQTGSDDALRIATACGRHLLARDRVGSDGARTWVSAAFGRPVNGMSHGAAGYAYALASLAAATGVDEFAAAASECVTFEAKTFDTGNANWADMRGVASTRVPTKWCYGAPGIGLSRAAIQKHTPYLGDACRVDIARALASVEQGWAVPTDTLCCGTLGSIEFLAETGALLDRDDLSRLAATRLFQVLHTAHTAGDYRYTTGTSRFNLGLFRGVAGLGYTALRRADTSLPNILIWE